MKIDDAFLDVLINPKNEKERGDLSGDLTEQLEREFVASTRKMIEKDLKVIQLNAQQYSDVYWAVCESVKEDAVESELIKIGTRVRIKNGTLCADWYKNRFVSAGPNTKKKVFSTHIKKGKGYRYAMHHFSREPEWCKQAVSHVEAKYALHRQRAAVLSSIKRSLNEYEKLLNEAYSDD